jgi:transposase
VIIRHQTDRREIFEQIVVQLVDHQRGRARRDRLRSCLPAPVARGRRQAVFPTALCSGLNPIEQVFAKLKTLLRKAAERTIEATWKRIGTLPAAFSPTECANYFANAGYPSA